MVKLNRKIQCADGFEMSVQANEGAYCTPRVDGADAYTHAEVGYPSLVEELLLPYAEDPDKPCVTVYGWVPAHVITIICAKHRGIVSGELPVGIPYLRSGSEELHESR